MTAMDEANSTDGMMDAGDRPLDVEDTESLETMEDRKLAYGFLASIYLTEVSGAFLKSLGEDPQSVPTELHDLACELAGADDDKVEDMRVKLANEYVRLFDAMGPDPVWTYESPYSNGQEMLMQHARDEVLAAYREQGFDRAHDFRYPEDHISAELEFMGLLCGKTEAALEQGDMAEARGLLAKQDAFLNDHLLTWVPKMLDKVDARARTEFYRGVSHITRELLESDAAYLAQEVGR